MSQYIPDLTERFPEGFDGVDMTPSYFGEPVDWSRAIREDDFEEECEIFEEEIEPRQFEIGNEYREVGIYGGVTYYKVEEIDRENKKILLSETWVDVDGAGKRPAEWHRLEVDENGGERALEWTSKDFGDIWIYA
jgi:hypothetical protein